MYNVVDVSFMKVYKESEGRIPTFKLDPSIGLSEQEFVNQIAELNKQGRAVLLALGGADAHIELQKGDEHTLANEIIRLTDRYGFDGLDIDLEQAAIDAGDNQTVIPQALRIVKDTYRAQGKNFLITMAPEFPYLRDNAKYIPYIKSLEGYYDWINPQFYNQGGDGIWIDGVGWIAQDNDALKKEFIYYIADSLTSGTRGFYKIPHNKLVFGIPTNIDAAATGFIKNPQDLYDAFDQLATEGKPLHGIMTWSINWDMGTNASAGKYNEEFIKTYGPYIHSQTSQPDNGSDPVLNGVGNERVQYYSNFDPMLHVTAIDNEDGDLTSQIIVEGHVNTHTVGVYALIYRVKDTDNNTTSSVREIEVYRTAPVLKGVTDVNVELGTVFDPLKGVSATDEEDGDLTGKIKVSGQVDTATVATYTLTYSVTDSTDQTTSSSRKVTVVEGDLCVVASWNINTTYVEGDTVMHRNTLWVSGWWTRGEEPGTTGEWGVWTEVKEGSCG